MAIYRVTSLLDNSLLRIRLSNGNSVFINPGESRDVTELNSGMIHAETLGECLITKKDASLTEIRTLSGMPVAEFAPIASIVFQTNTGYTNTPKAVIVSVDGSYTDHRFTLVRSGSMV